MDAIEFERQARADPQLDTLLREVAEEMGKQVSVEGPPQYLTVTGVDLLVGIAAYALYRWAKDYFDHRRALHETEILRQQQQVVAALVEGGFPPKEAQAAALALLRNIAKRTEDDPALQKVGALMGKE